MPRTNPVVTIPVDSIREYGRNPRKHTDDQLRHLAESMRRFGFVVPVLVDAENVLVAGHGRVAAATRVWDGGFDIPGCERGMVPAIRITGMSDAEIRAYRIADNKLAQLSRFDTDSLNATLRELCGPEGFSASSLGFDEAELALLLGRDERRDAFVLGTESIAGDAPRVPTSRFSCLMSAEQRDTINAQLEQIRSRLSLPSAGAALAEACRRFAAQ